MLKSVNLHLGFTTAALQYPEHKKKYLYLAASSSHLLKQIRNFNPDIVISHFLFTGTFAASRLCSELNIPLHIRLHTNYSTLSYNDAQSILEHASSLSSISAKLALDTLHKYNLERDIKLIRQDVDLSALENVEDLNSDSADNQFVAIGRLVPKKGFYQLIEAFSRLDDQYTLNIYGDGPLLTEIKSRIIELGQEYRIKLKGQTEHKQLMTEIKAAKALIAPSVSDNGDEDGIPTVIVEAMALKTIVLSSDISAISELIEDRETGYMLDCTSVEALYQSLNTAISDIDNWPGIIEQAHKKVLLEYSRKININDIN
jgi:glycosyltransferase involved in cell wall biosynthesis